MALILQLGKNREGYPLGPTHLVMHHTAMLCHSPEPGIPRQQTIPVIPGEEKKRKTFLMVFTYLPRGSSPSSLRQRDVGTGSPCTSQ